MAFNSRFLVVLLFGLAVLFSTIECKRIRRRNYDVENNLKAVSEMNDKSISLLSGEWLVTYLAVACPISTMLDPILDKLSENENLKQIKFAKITLFPVDQDIGYPLLFHTKNGIIRKYEGPLEYDNLVKYLQEANWPKMSSVKSKTIDYDGLKHSFANIFWGTLGMAVLIFLFAWVIDMTSCHKNRRRNFEELTEEEDEDAIGPEDPDEVVDESQAEVEKLNQTENQLNACDSQADSLDDDIDLIDIKGMREDNEMNSSEDCDCTSQGDSSETIIQNKTEETPAAPQKPLKLNPFESSNESLINSESDLFETLPEDKESILDKPIEEISPAQDCIEETENKESSSTETPPEPLSPKKTQPPNPAKPKIVKFKDIDSKDLDDIDSITKDIEKAEKEGQDLEKPITESVGSGKNKKRESQC